MRERNYALTEEERAIVRTWQSATQFRTVVAGYLSCSAFASCWRRFVEPSLAKTGPHGSAFIAASRVLGAATAGATAAFLVVKIQAREVVRQLCVVGEEDSNLGGETRAIVKALAPLDPYVNGGARSGGVMPWPFAMAGAGAGARAGGRRTREAAAPATTSAANDDDVDEWRDASFAEWPDASSASTTRERRVPERAPPPKTKTPPPRPSRSPARGDGSSSTPAPFPFPFASASRDAWGLERDDAADAASRRAAEKRAKYQGVGNSASRAREEIERRKLRTREEHRARVAASRRAAADAGEGAGEGAFARGFADAPRARDLDARGIPRRGVRRTAYGDEMDR
jgi:hypothetical protein